MFPQLLHLQALTTAQTPSGGCGGGPDQLLLPVIMFAILYFVWLRPAQNERKNHTKMLEGLKRGDKIVTTGGMIGTIADKTEKTITVQVDRNSKIEMLNSAVARKFAPEAEKKDDASSKKKS